MSDFKDAEDFGIINEDILFRELVRTNLHYFGRGKLTKMDFDGLAALAKLMCISEPIPKIACEDARRMLIEAILKKKEENRRAKSKSKKIAAVSAVASEDKEDDEKEDDDDEEEEEDDDDDEEKEEDDDEDVFKKRHYLKICAFNSLKLRVGKAGLEAQWLGFAKTLSTFDIIIISEVPAECGVTDIKNTRNYGFKLMLEAFTKADAIEKVELQREKSKKNKEEEEPEDGKEQKIIESKDEAWSMHLSEPSGPGNPEIHTVFVRKPLRVLQKETCFKTTGGVELDHAPFTLEVLDERFRSDANKHIVISSVHFPPSSRAKARDTQLKAFLADYTTKSNVRLHRPFTAQGAKDAKMNQAIHLVAGDFNTFPEFEHMGFSSPLLGSKISTSSGNQAYDNFLLNRDSTSRLSWCAEVLELSNIKKKGEDGLSDHHPILLKIIEQTTTRKK